MAFTLTTTNQAARVNGIKVCVYGLAGVGKTRLCMTLPGEKIIISAEGGLLSLRDEEIPVAEIKTMADVDAAYNYLTSSEGSKFESIAFDSISEIAETVLAAEKKTAKDPRQAYGALTDEMNAFIRRFRDLPGRNVYMSAKAERVPGDNAVGHQPSLPGSRIGQGLGYYFDELFVMRAEPHPDGGEYIALQTQRTPLYDAKDRSGSLDYLERPDLTYIADKIKAGTKPVQPPAAQPPTNQQPTTE